MGSNYESVLTPAGRVLIPIQPQTPKEIVYEIIGAFDLMPHYGHHPSYPSLSDAASHLGAGEYIVATENGWPRQLTAEEEALLQSRPL